MIPEISIAKVGHTFSQGLEQLEGHLNGSNFALRKWISLPSLMLIINPGELLQIFWAHSIPFFAALTIDSSAATSM